MKFLIVFLVSVLASAQNVPTRLPNLLKVSKISDLYPMWDVQGSIQLEAGRLVVKEGAGLIWTKNQLANSKEEWTIDVVFRNSEQVEVDDHTFYDTNGLSVWLLDSYIPKENTYFGGPKRFDGLQILINNKNSRGVKIFANDGSIDTENTPEASVGGCNINYLDSMIPFTLRISYSASKNWFKVQIDNSLCFKTDAISFEHIRGGLNIGVSASTNPSSKEYWELLRLDTVDLLTEDAIDDHSIIDGGANVVTVTTRIESEPTFQPAQNRVSLMERTRRFQDELPSREGIGRTKHRRNGLENGTIHERRHF